MQVTRDLTDRGERAFKQATTSWQGIMLSEGALTLHWIDDWFGACEQVLADWRRYEPADDDPVA